MKFQPTRTKVAALSMTVAVTLALSGCSVTGSTGQSGASGGDSGTINLLVMKQASYSESDVAKMVKEFEKSNPAVKVNTTFVAYEALHDKIVAAAPAGTYDVVETDVDLPEFASKGLVADVTQRVPANWKSQMVSGALQAAEYNGKYYGVPWGPSTKLFFYNKTMLGKVGAKPSDLTSWAGVLAVAQKIKAAGLAKYPLSWSWSQAEALICDYAQILGASGGSFTDSNGKLDLSSPAAVAALTWMKQTLDDGLSDPASVTFLEDDTDKSMASGRTAFELNWESAYRDLNDPSTSKVVGDIGVLPTPAGPSGANPSINGAEVLSVTAGSKHQTAAWKLASYLGSEPVQDQFATSSMTNWKASYTNPSVVATNPQVFAADGVAFNSMILRPQVPNYNAVSQALQVQIQSALLGKKMPKQALDVAASSAAAAG